MTFKKLTKDEKNYWSSRVNSVFGDYKKKVADSIDIKQNTLEDVREEYMAEVRRRFEEELMNINQSNFESYFFRFYAPSLKTLGKDESYNRCMKIREVCEPMKVRKDKMILLVNECSSQEEFDEIIDFVKECRDYNA